MKSGVEISQQWRTQISHWQPKKPHRKYLCMTMAPESTMDETRNPALTMQKKHLLPWWIQILSLKVVPKHGLLLLVALLVCLSPSAGSIASGSSKITTPRICSQEPVRPRSRGSPHFKVRMPRLILIRHF